MTGSELLPDLVLCLMAVVLTMGALFAPTRRDAMALFMAFGVVLALIWARLGAPDLALAEAAIGAGLTGTLLLHAARLLPAEQRRPHHGALPLRAIVFIAAAVGAFALALADQQPDLLAAPQDTGLFAENMDRSAVSHPVTAVLLEFRAWDTLLELLVLLLALTGLRQLFAGPAPAVETRQPWPLLKAWTQWLTVLLVVVGGFLLWNGSHAPGGAFQAGALLAAAGVLLRLTGLLPATPWSLLAVRTAASAGVLVFLLTAITTHLMGEAWLAYPGAWAYVLIVSIELVATLSIAVTLFLLVVGDHGDMKS